MSNTAKETIETIYKDYQEYSLYLEKEGQISFLSDYRNIFSKTILLSVASYFEDEIKQIIHKILLTSESNILEEFIKNKALNRQYHTLFSWNENNANSFFAFFGQNFKTFMKSQVDSKEELKLSIQDFLWLGRTRNKLVHENYAIFNIDMTVEEIFEKFKSALIFIDSLIQLFQEFNKKAREDSTEKSLFS